VDQNQILGAIHSPSSRLPTNVTLPITQSNSVSARRIFVFLRSARMNHVQVFTSVILARLADYSKLGKSSICKTVPIEAITRLVTDYWADRDILHAFREAGVKVIVAPQDSSEQA